MVTAVDFDFGGITFRLLVLDGLVVLDVCDFTMATEWQDTTQRPAKFSGEDSNCEPPNFIRDGSEDEESSKKRGKTAHSALSAKVTDKSQDGKIFQIGKSQIVGKTTHNAVSKSQGKTPERSPQNLSAKAVHIHTGPVHAHVTGKSAPGYLTSDEDTSSDSD
jgi:hypothetical protein